MVDFCCFVDAITLDRHDYKSSKSRIGLIDHRADLVFISNDTADDSDAKTKKVLRTTSCE